MKHHIRTLFNDELLCRYMAYVEIDEAKSILVQLRIAQVVGRTSNEIVESDNRPSVGEQSINQGGANKAGAARYDCFQESTRPASTNAPANTVASSATTEMSPMTAHRLTT